MRTPLRLTSVGLAVLLTSGLLAARAIAQPAVGTLTCGYCEEDYGGGGSVWHRLVDPGSTPPPYLDYRPEPFGYHSDWQFGPCYTHHDACPAIAATLQREIVLSELGLGTMCSADILSSLPGRIRQVSDNSYDILSCAGGVEATLVVPARYLRMVVSVQQFQQLSRYLSGKNPPLKA
jgi:hypothetical protein